MTDQESFRIERAAHHIDSLIEILDRLYTAQGYQTQTLASGDNVEKVLQVAAKSGLRSATGMSLAATAKFAYSESDLVFSVAGAQWIDKVVSGGIGALVFAPTLVTSAVGAVKQSKLLSRLQADILATTSNLRLEHDELSSEEWWQLLDRNWKTRFTSSMGIESNPSEDDFASLFARTDFDFTNAGIFSLAPLKAFSSLENVACGGVSNNGISSLSPLRFQTALTQLDCHFNRIGSLEPIREAVALRHLNCSFTGVSDLAALSEMAELKTLKIRGTQISSLEPLSGLKKLEHLEVQGCSALSRSEIATFKKAHPNCKVRRWF